MKNLVLFLPLFIILTGCRKDNSLIIYPINENFNKFYEYKNDEDFSRYCEKNICQYFYIKNYENISNESLSDSILSFANSQIEIKKFLMRNYTQYFYKKRFLKKYSYRDLQDFSEGDPPSIYDDGMNLICQIMYNRINENPVIYGRRLILYNKDSIVYENVEFLVNENDNVKVLNEKEFSSTYKTPRR